MKMIGGYIPAGLLPVSTGYLIDVIGIAAGATSLPQLCLRFPLQRMARKPCPKAVNPVPPALSTTALERR